MSPTNLRNDSFSTKLLVDLSVVLQQVLHHLAKRLVVGHACGVRRVLFRILVGRVGSNLRRDIVADIWKE